MLFSKKMSISCRCILFKKMSSSCRVLVSHEKSARVFLQVGVSSIDGAERLRVGVAEGEREVGENGRFINQFKHINRAIRRPQQKNSPQIEKDVKTCISV